MPGALARVVSAGVVCWWGRDAVEFLGITNAGNVQKAMSKNQMCTVQRMVHKLSVIMISIYSIQKCIGGMEVGMCGRCGQAWH